MPKRLPLARPALPSVAPVVLPVVLPVLVPSEMAPGRLTVLAPPVAQPLRRLRARRDAGVPRPPLLLFLLRGVLAPGVGSARRGQERGVPSAGMAGPLRP